jgi:tRNA U34 5-carboxymethylaminomethyl modifying GTPase MnmE/TrmE
MFLRNAWNNLGPVSSEPLDEAVLNGIFSRFCIGK